MKKIKVLIFSGYGLNCEEETKFAFEMADASVDIVHINDLIANHTRLQQYSILVFPGGFSYGDDTGSGNAFANKVRNHLWTDIEKFITKDRLILGICNGFQIIANLGLLPSLNNVYGKRQIALMHNDTARYTVRWTDLEVENSKSPWFTNLKTILLPIAHGEGKLFTTKEIFSFMKEKNQIALRYTNGDICKFFNYQQNPTGTIDNIAGITDSTGRILGLMPHPERAVLFTQQPHWTYLKELYSRQGKKLPKYGPGLAIFKNAVRYFI